jgi:heme/copper-type cytochrome/quinol oxidase subunit 2
MVNRLLNIGTLVALAVGLAVSLLIGGCDEPVLTLSGSVPMKCVWSFISVSILFIVALILGVVRLFLKTTEARRFAALSLGLTALAAALICSPWGIGICSGETMALCSVDPSAGDAGMAMSSWFGSAMDCHTSALVVWIVAALVVIGAIIQAVIASFGKEPDTKKPKMFELR